MTKCWIIITWVNAISVWRVKRSQNCYIFYHHIAARYRKIPCQYLGNQRNYPRERERERERESERERERERGYLQ